MDTGLRWVTSILLLIFPTATLFLNRGDSYVFGLLTLIGVWVWLRDGARRWLDRPAALLWIAFVLFFAVALLSYLLGTQTDAGFRFLGRYLRFLLIVPVYLALRRYLPTAKTVFIGLALGALLAGVIGGIHLYRADIYVRIEATTGLSIIFGDLTATMVLCTVAGFGLLADSKRKWIILLLTLCLGGGIAATLLSGTRGAWAPLFLLIPILLIPANGALKRRYQLAVALIVIAIFLSFYLISSTGTRDRINLVLHSTNDYFLAQQAFSGENLKVFTGPMCVNQEAWLNEWTHFYYYLKNDRPPGIEIVKDPLIEKTDLCKDQYAVRLHNPSLTTWWGYVFPRLTRNEGGVQTSTILARGDGSFVLNSDGKGDISFSSSSFRRVALHGNNWSGEWIRIYIAPGKGAWLVPLDSYPGEYSLSIANNSIGQRFELWRGAWMIFLRHPTFGAGIGAFEENANQLVARGRLAEFANNYDHPHNDYLNALSSSGIVGFLILLAIFLVPLVYFWRALRSKDAISHAVGLAGALTVLGFAIYALTDTIFLHSMMITWYVVYMALFYALLDAQADKLAKPEPPRQ